MARHLLLSAFLLVLASGCSKGDAEPEPAGGSAEHAASGVKPGSHEDWCGEHGVPESQCTRCNRKLEAAFKATGDWCKEHGLPQSQCVKCDPNRKAVRPPKGN